MSRLLQLVNRLKEEARTELLTDSQRVAVAAVEKEWQLPERVNLVGPPGTGKTFIGWALARSHGPAFLASPRALRDVMVHETQPLIVDNVPGDDRELRTLIAELQLLDVRCALLISVDENRLGLPVVRLDYPTQDDVDIIYHNLSLLEHYALTPLVEGNIWQVIYSTFTISER